MFQLRREHGTKTTMVVLAMLAFAALLVILLIAVTGPYRASGVPMVIDYNGTGD